MSLGRELFNLYDFVALHSITSRRFNQAQMLAWLQPILTQGGFTSAQAGLSAEGRAISLLTMGRGPLKVLLWSQMHGDESTATMALVDILNFFSLHPRHDLVSSITSSLTLLILPMLNPDGAERFQRRTAQQVDMNRDAVKLQTPEARLLKKIQNDMKPSFGFNLHDQDARYSVGQTTLVTAVALLAPPIDSTGSENDVQHRAKQVAALLAETLDEFIPGHVARYDDTFEPRAFGDNIQRWGTSTILVESGGWKDDPEKMFLRKLNFVGLLMALEGIASGNFNKKNTASYENLPFNGKNFYDVILRGIRLMGGTMDPIVADIGINFTGQIDRATGAQTSVGTVVDVGDLAFMGSYEEYQCSGVSLDAGMLRIDQQISREELLRLIGR